MPHTRYATRVLRSEGLEAPAPILTQYKFPVRDPSKPAFMAQKITCALLTIDSRAYVLNELGTGKTRCILWAYDFLRKRGLVKRLLVICPISALIRTWAKEILDEFPWLSHKVLYGTKKVRLDRLKEEVDVYIINHDGIEVIYDELIARKDINCVAADEVAVYRNGNSNRTLFFRNLASKKDTVWGLTGSPIPKAVTDVWGPCSAITPDTIPQFFTWFRAQLMYKDPDSPFRWYPKPGSEERAVACMRPAVRFALSDITELPPQIHEYYEADLTPRQAFVYEEMRKTAVALVDGKKIDALNSGAVLSKLLQIAIGYVYTRDGKIVTFDNTPRLQLILDLVDSAVKKVILFAPFKSVIAALSIVLNKNKIDHCIVTGDVTMKKRNILFGEFQDTPKYKVLLAHPNCMAHALTLTAATTTIWAGPTTSLDVFTQANRRTYRLGQDSKTLVAMIGGTNAEKRLYKLLGNNEKIQNRFLEIVEEITDRDYLPRKEAVA